MKKFIFAILWTVILVAGIASTQAISPTQPVQATRVILRVAADQWRNVSFRADSAMVEEGGMRLTGNVRIGSFESALPPTSRDLGVREVRVIDVAGAARERETRL